MPQVLRFLVSPALVLVSHVALLLLPLGAAVSSSMAASSPLPAPPSPGCPSKCGSIDIPYPFGIGVECAWPGGGDFLITCNNSFSPPRPYTGNIEITSISVEAGEMHVYGIVASVCYNSSSTIDLDQGVINWSLVRPFLISPTENVFTAIGCDTLAFLTGGSSYFTGCISYCASLDESALDGDPCTGLGCCQTSSIPGNLSTLEVGWNTGNITVNNSAWEYSPCKHAFVANKHWYHFSRQDLKGRGNDKFSNRDGDRSAPLVLDWAIRGNGSCKMTPESSGVSSVSKLTAPACASAHSYCEDLNATRGGGYLCKCSKGYMGNPYIINGCTNINECNSGTNDPCGLYSTCEDTDGDYNCKCNINRKGNGKSEEGCHEYYFPPYAIAATAILFVVVLGCILIIVYQRQRKRKRFTNNGGKVLRKKGMTIYTERDLKKITTSYSKFLGGGLFGNVYEGRIDGPPGQKVAVKRSVRTRRVPYLWKKLIGHEVAQTGQVEEDGSFINEIQFQFDAGHKNMVKLLGCCLETDIPILVFEFVSNGSLQDALHGASDKPCAISLLKRLDIAIGSAEALSYMHSLGNHKHVHGDIKPANILLDHDLNPKVSDFGSSKLLSVDSYYTRGVAADWSYIDPVYINTDHYTVKSDVYSFGVVLLELITRKTAIYDGNKRLPFEFVKCFRDNGTGRMMFDIDLFSGDDDTQSQRYMECLDRIAMLAVRCLMLDDVDKRPTMADVVEELKHVKVMATGGSSSSDVEAS